MKLIPYLTPLIKINLKWIKVLNRRGNSIKLLEENVEKKLLDFGLGNDFFGYNTKSTNTKSKSQQSGAMSNLNTFAQLKKQLTKGILWEFQKNICFCFIDYAKAFDCVDHNKLWKILKEMGVPDHLTCLLWNLCAGQEATVSTGHGTMDWFHIGKGMCQVSILSPCLLNLYAEYIVWNAKLDEAQAGIKIARKNINSLRYADDTTLVKRN